MRTFLIAAATTALLAASLAPTAWAEDSLRDKVIGTWKLISWESLRSSGEVVNVWMGLHPTGVIMYQPNGYMAVQIMADPRPAFADNPATTPPSYEELRNAFFGYYAYWGRYTINNAGDGVVHDVQASERPAEVGLKYPRSVSIEGSGSITNGGWTALSCLTAASASSAIFATSRSKFRQKPRVSSSSTSSIIA